METASVTRVGLVLTVVYPSRSITTLATSSTSTPGPQNTVMNFDSLCAVKARIHVLIRIKCVFIPWSDQFLDHIY